MAKSSIDKDFIHSFTEKSTIQKIFFCGIMTVLVFLFFKGFVSDPRGMQLNVFFGGMNDMFADFFNVLRYISEKDPYFNEINGYGEKAYLPLSYLILYPFSRLESYSTISLYQAWFSRMSTISVVLFLVFSLGVLFASLSSLYGNNKYKFWILFLLLFSGISLFSIERANLIIFTSGCIVVFIASYRSDNKVYKYIGLVFLCIAATLKVYPILLGILLLKDKDYRSIIFCAIVTFLLVFVPFKFFEHGYSNFYQLLNNVKISSVNYGPERIFPRFSVPNLMYIVSQTYHFSESLTQIVISISKIIVIVLSIASLTLVFLVKERWKELALVIFVLLQVPTNSALYCGLYFFPVIILFFIKTEFKKIDWLYILLFCVFLNPYQLFAILGGLSGNSVLSNISIILMWILTITTSLFEYYKIYKFKRAPQLINSI